jgi:hypothetical protein
VQLLNTLANKRPDLIPRLALDDDLKKLIDPKQGIPSRHLSGQSNKL